MISNWHAIFKSTQSNLRIDCLIHIPNGSTRIVLFHYYFDGYYSCYPLVRYFQYSVLVAVRIRTHLAKLHIVSLTVE